MTRTSQSVMLSLLGALVAGALAIPAQAEEAVTSQRLLDPEPENWLMKHGNYATWRYSELDEINAGNVGSLKLAFAYLMRDDANHGISAGRTVQSTPVVNGGMLYITNASAEVFKLDVRSGLAELLWRFDPEEEPIATLTQRNRGVALTGDMVIVNTSRGHAYALDRRSGEVLWDRMVADGITAEATSSVPYVVNDKVYIGQSYGDAATRGWVEAVNRETGEQIWRTYLTPAPDEPGGETWPGETYLTGGASIWTQPSYDPDLNWLYYGTSNASPAWDPEYRPGDNLYTASTVVLDADTGEFEWYHQYIPNEGMEFDEINPRVLTEVEIGGEMRRVTAMHSTRAGFFYVLDRVSGEFLSATPNVPGMSSEEALEWLWTDGFDLKTGKPVEYDPNVLLQVYAGHNVMREGFNVPVCSTRTSWGAQAYHPGMNRVYSVVFPNCRGPRKAVPAAYMGGGFGEYAYGCMVDGELLCLQRPSRLSESRPLSAELAARVPQTKITATDVATGEIVASGPAPHFSNPNGGTLATAGGLVFTAHEDGDVQAYDARTLQPLWSINVGTDFDAAPISYAVAGKQYIAINGGDAKTASVLWVFTL